MKNAMQQLLGYISSILLLYAMASMYFFGFGNPYIVLFIGPLMLPFTIAVGMGCEEKLSKNPLFNWLLMLIALFFLFLFWGAAYNTIGREAMQELGLNTQTAVAGFAVGFTIALAIALNGLISTFKDRRTKEEAEDPDAKFMGIYRMLVYGNVGLTGAAISYLMVLGGIAGEPAFINSMAVLNVVLAVISFGSIYPPSAFEPNLLSRIFQLLAVLFTLVTGAVIALTVDASSAPVYLALAMGGSIQIVRAFFTEESVKKSEAELETD